MRLAVIPARGGSKRIPGKNIRLFCGRPMIEWTIAALRESACFDHIVVSTDDDKVAAVAEAAGAEVPFRRPAELADDYTPTLPVIAHAIQTLAQTGKPPQFVCCAYATAPLLDERDVRSAFETLCSQHVDYVFSVTTFEFPIQRALKASASGGVEPMFPEYIGSRSQELMATFHDAGQFYWGRAEAYLAQRPFFSPDARAHFVPRHRVQDIDTLEDWARAELLFRTFKESCRE